MSEPAQQASDLASNAQAGFAPTNCSVPEVKFLCLAHARTVRDKFAEWALDDTDAERIERWCRAEGNWQCDLLSTMEWIGQHWDGNGMPGYWSYLLELKAAIEYIAEKEKAIVQNNRSEARNE